MGLLSGNAELRRQKLESLNLRPDKRIGRAWR